MTDPLAPQAAVTLPDGYARRLAGDVSNVFALPYETPFLGLDLSRVTDAYARLRNALPDTRVHFAMKCNADTRLLKAIHDLGGSFVIASCGELAMLQRLGIAGGDGASNVAVDNVLFSNPVKRPADIAGAYAANVRRFAFDSEREADKIAEFAPGSAVYVRLKTQAGGSAVASEGKFGVPADRACQLLLYAARLGLVPYGIAFHVGSQMTDATAWETAIGAAAHVMRDLADKRIRLEMLDLGGGFPVHYAGEPVPDISVIGASITAALRQLPYPVQTVVEPGRFLAAPAGVIVASVIGVADRDGRRWLHLDAGAFNAFMEALETGNRLIYPVTDSLGQDRTRAFHLTGPTCDSQDTVLYDVGLSHDLDVGDRVCFGQAGAYTLCYAATAFNGFGPPAAYLTAIAA